VGGGSPPWGSQQSGVSFGLVPASLCASCCSASCLFVGVLFVAGCAEGAEVAEIIGAAFCPTEDVIDLGCW